MLSTIDQRLERTRSIEPVVELVQRIYYGDHTFGNDSFLDALFYEGHPFVDIVFLSRGQGPIFENGALVSVTPRILTQEFVVSPAALRNAGCSVMQHVGPITIFSWFTETIHFGAGPNNPVIVCMEILTIWAACDACGTISTERMPSWFNCSW